MQIVSATRWVKPAIQKINNHKKKAQCNHKINNIVTQNKSHAATSLVSITYQDECKTDEMQHQHCCNTSLPSSRCILGH